MVHLTDPIRLSIPSSIRPSSQQKWWAIVALIMNRLYHEVVLGTGQVRAERILQNRGSGRRDDKEESKGDARGCTGIIGINHRNTGRREGEEQEEDLIFPMYYYMLVPVFLSTSIPPSHGFESSRRLRLCPKKRNNHLNHVRFGSGIRLQSHQQ